MNIIALILCAVGGTLFGGALTFLYKRIGLDKRSRELELKAQHTLEQANEKSKQILEDAQNKSNAIVSAMKQDAESEIKSRQHTITEIENRLLSKETQLNDKSAALESKNESLDDEIDRLKSLKVKHEDLIKALSTKLESVAGMSQSEAEKQLLANVEIKSRHKAGELIKNLEEQAKKIATHRAREIVTDAIQRTAVDHVRTATTSVVQLPDDDMKGRVIGREGRNIRAFEAITGVDIIIDDAPGTVIISAFDPIRREVARIALSNLIQDGRIQPSRVEEYVENAKKQLKEITVMRGEEVADKLGQEFHPELIELMGKLYYRHSYGQNIWHHSLETAHIAGAMAAELGVNVNLAKRGGMLHDIGKALDFEQEGSHTVLGRDVCQKCGESPEILNCIMAHHEEEPPDTIEAVLVMMADAISSVRPGARSESIDSYIKRLQSLEAIANSYSGVEKSFAIQAGREVRVMVRPDDVDDTAAKKIAFDIAQDIEKTVDYPGLVKVVVIRESRAQSIAK